jgi:hypothetical protein
MMSPGLLRLAFLCVLLCGNGLLSGCVTQPLPRYQISLENQTALASLPPAVRYSTSSVNAPLQAQASVRGYSAMTPERGWSGFLQDGLTKELTSARHYADASDRNIEVTVQTLKLKDGVADLQARFVVRKSGVITYDKVLAVQTQWSSSFLGVLAVQDAVSQFGAVFQQLQRKFFADPDFIRQS